MPMLVKQGLPEFPQWGHGDLQTLLASLPSIHKGAGPWIREFEMLTVADHLALWDDRCLLKASVGLQDQIL